MPLTRIKSTGIANTESFTFGSARITGNTIISNVNMAGAIYDNVSFSVATQEDTPSAISLSADGKKMFVMGTTGDDVNEYNLTTPWLASSAVFVRVFSVASQENFPTALFFRPDGLKFYVVGHTNSTVYQYALTLPWDLSTASYESKSFSVVSQENNTTGIFFRPNGLSMYITGSSTDSVYQYTLTTPWDVSTASYLQSFNVQPQEATPQDLSFTNDGTRMFVMGNIGDDVNIYNLGTPWNISTAVFSTTFSVAAQDNAPIGMFVEVDGSRFYMLGSSNDTVYQYRLPLTTIEFTGNTFINGDASVTQNLSVEGSASFNNDITVRGNLTSSNIFVSGYNVFSYITNAYAQANAAFLAANTGGAAGVDNVARQTANAAFIQANAAYAKANTGGGGGGVSNNGTTLSGTITPLANTSEQFNIVGVTGDITIAAPAGTPTDGQKLIIRIKDAGTAVNVSWNVIYRVVGTNLPTSTVPNKTAYIGFIYNTADIDWDAVAVTFES